MGSWNGTSGRGTEPRIMAADVTQPPPAPTSVIDRPLVKYFTVTAALGSLLLVMLVIYCVVSYLENRRALREGLKHAPRPRDPNKPKREPAQDNNRAKYAFPFVLRKTPRS